MGISRGFRRLSVLVGFTGLTVIVFLWFVNAPPFPTSKQVIVGIMLFVGGPVIFVLALGWVVAGFHKSN
jgi:hypothetical protein